MAVTIGQSQPASDKVRALHRVESLVKGLARELGFDLVGIASAEAFARDREAALERVRQGLMDGLPWYNPSRVLRGTDPQALLPGARSIISVALSYHVPEGGQAPGLRGRVARYAWGDDYHKVMKNKLKSLAEGLSQRLGRPVQARWYVDDGPMLDRAVAERAGIGWFGKNTCILTPTHGSWVFLGQLITDVELEPDPPLKKTCGQCVRCIDACPTGAIVAPYLIDNRRCISYLTIENRGPIPRELRPLIGDWVFGCDICQEVCPVNRKAAPSQEPAFQRRGLSTLELTFVLSMTQEEFLERFRGSPIKRAKLEGLKRNACVVLGNLGDVSAVPALARALGKEAPLVRGHAAWALGRIGGGPAEAALEEALGRESDPQVVEEVRAALEEARRGRQ